MAAALPGGGDQPGGGQRPRANRLAVRWLFAFLSAPSQRKSALTTNAVKRPHAGFTRRIKTQAVPPSAETAAMLFWALLASGPAKREAFARDHHAPGGRRADPGREDRRSRPQRRFCRVRWQLSGCNKDQLDGRNDATSISPYASRAEISQPHRKRAAQDFERFRRRSWVGETRGFPASRPHWISPWSVCTTHDVPRGMILVTRPTPGT